jgi:hypothetical protein
MGAALRVVEGQDTAAQSLAIQPLSAIFCKAEFTQDAQFVTALVLECNSMLTTTPMSTLDEDMLGTILSFTIWPNNSPVLMRDIAKTATAFVLDKKQLAVCIMRQLFLCNLIIRGRLILKLRLAVPGSNESLSIFLSSSGSEMGLPSKTPFYLLHNRSTSASTKMCRHT